jgi:hypothetical protein
VAVRIFRQTELDSSNQALRRFIAVPMHVPALLHEPILKLVQTYLTSKVAVEPFADLTFGNHEQSVCTKN